MDALPAEHYISEMTRVSAFIPAMVIGVLAVGSAAAQQRTDIGIEQLNVPSAAKSTIGVSSIDRSLSSRSTRVTEVTETSDKTAAACRQAQAQDRAAPAGIDCLKALQDSTTKQSPTAEVSLLGMLAQNLDIAAPVQGVGNGTISADNVVRQLSAGDLQGSAGSDVAASVARDRATPVTAPPPR